MNPRSPEERWIESGCGKIVYFKSSSLTGRPTVVFLHGLSSNHTTWLNAMEALRARGVNSIALDLRGHGHSDKTREFSRYALSVLSEDLKKVAEAEGLSRFILVGYSFGGSVAIEYALAYPESVAGLFLVSTNYVSPFRYRGLGFLLPAASLLLASLAHLLVWQRRTSFRYYQHGASVGYWHSVWDGWHTVPLSINFWMLREAVTADFKERIARISAPTLLMWGPKDWFITRREVDDMATLIPRARVVVSKNPSHFIATNLQTEVTETLIGFLDHYENRDFL